MNRIQMSIAEMQQGIEQLEREIASLRESIAYQNTLAVLRDAIASIDTDPGMPLDEFAATFKRHRDSKKAANS